MKTESTFSEALARHRQLMQYFGATLTVEDHQRGAMLEALHLLETDQKTEACKVLLASLKEHGTEGANAEVMTRAVNWLDCLEDSESGKFVLRQALAVASKPA